MRCLLLVATISRGRRRTSSSSIVIIALITCLNSLSVAVLKDEAAARAELRPYAAFRHLRIRQQRAHLRIPAQVYTYTQ
jgi:hypothetical protein